MAKRFLTLILVMFTLINTSGCWNRVEPENYSWVTWIGLDRLADGKVKMTVVVTPPLSPVPTGSAPPESLMLVSSATGSTLFEAARNLTSHVPKRLFWSYLQAVIISEDLARSGVEQHIDTLFRNVRNRKNAWVFITKGSTEPIFKIDPKIEVNPAKLIESLVKAEHGFLGTSRVIRLKDFQTELEGPGIDTVVAALGVWDPKNETILPPGAKTPQKGELALDGSAVFRGDKLIGWLSQEETRVLNIAKGDLKAGTMVVPHPDNPQNLALVEIIKSSTKLKAQIAGNQVEASIKIKIKGNLGDQRLDSPARTIETPIEEPEFYRSLGKELEQKIKSEIDELIAKSQTEFGSDIFGVGDYIMSRYPKDWKRISSDWQNYYRKATIDVQVKVTIETPNVMRSHLPGDEKAKQPEPNE